MGKLRSGTVSLTSILLLTVLSVGTAVSASPGRGTTAATSRHIVTLRGLAPVAAQVATRGSRTPASARASAAAVRSERTRVAKVERRVSALETRLGFRAGTRYRYALQGFAASLSARQVALLRADPSVLSISPVRPVHPAAEVEPTGIVRVHAGLTDPAPSPNLVDVNVAVLDTGIRALDTPTDPPINETELNIGGGIDCANDAKAGQTTPDAWKDVDTTNGHGTHVAGTIGARNDVPDGAGTDIVGVAPGVKLWSVRIFTKQGGSIVGDTGTVACGVDWVASTRSVSPPEGTFPIDVANMSIQGPKDPVNDNASCTPTSPATPPTDAEHVAICAATNMGVAFVVAAGNQSRDSTGTVPAVYDEVITVAALSDSDGLSGGLGGASCGDPDDTFASYSNYGPAVDLIAPGTCIVSLSRTAGGTRSMSGTSMATPHVTGAAARYVATLLENLVPHHATNINVEVVKAALRASAGFAWDTSSDPDGVPDRLLDVQALTAADGLVVAAFPSLVKLRAPAGSPTDDSPPATFNVELQRVGLYDGDVTITNDGLPTGVTWDTPAVMSGLDSSGISQAVTFHASNLAVDDLYTVTLHATGSGVPDASTTLSLRIDRHRPTVANLQAQIVGGTLSSAVPVKLSWSGDDLGRPISRYELQRKVGTSGWQALGLSPSTATSTVKLIAPKTDYAFRVRAVDSVGNVGAWSPDLTLRLGIRDSKKPTIHYASGAWTTKSKSTAYGKSYRTARAPGAWAALSFSGQGVAWLAPVGPGKGTAMVKLDGLPAVLVDLDRTTTKPQRIVWSSGPLTPGPHHVIITIVSGTVDLDAILILG